MRFNFPRHSHRYLTLLLCVGWLAGLVFPGHAAFNTLLNKTEIPKLTGVSEILLLQSLDDASTIFSQNASRRTAPASLTKIMTAIVVLEALRDLNEVISAPKECIDLFAGRDSSNAGIRPGEQLTVEQLLYCMLLPSANEAAAILAQRVAGSQPAFVNLMNQKAEALGCTNTRFANSHGLDEEGHYSTAEDIATITRWALNRKFVGNAVFETITGSRTAEIPPTNLSRKRTLINTNKMLNRNYPDYYLPEILGTKTGTTDNAGDCIVTRVSRGGFNFLAVVLRGKKALIDNDPYTKNTALVDAKAMFEWALAHIRLRQVTDPLKAIAEVPVEVGRADHVQLVPAQELFAFVPEGIDSNSVLVEAIPATMPKHVAAPIQKGQVIARARILYAGEEFAQVDLMAAEDVHRSATLYLIQLAKIALASPLTKLLFALLMGVSLLYLAAGLRHKYKQYKSRQLKVVGNVTRRRR